jgi:hypothetical protein
VTVDNLLTELLAAPLSPDWTVEALAEQLLGALAARRSEEAQEFVLDADATADRQSRRVLRPLLACLATKSAAEAGTAANLYGGRLSFQRQGPEGPVWILGQFENRPGTARVVFRRSTLPPQNSEPTVPQAPVLESTASHHGPAPRGVSKLANELSTRTPT